MLRLGMDHAQGVLCGGAAAIHGASAARAISSALLQTKESERFTLTVVVTVTTLFTIAHHLPADCRCAQAAA